ncbi:MULTISPECIES: NusG domain II-containing protein [Megasphaera]|uniref:Uncharacterized protein n=1 Tax=Megasphaera hutchinsoni TaxID=1588748 RepID=A0A2J8BA03_9FIRM|nr:MULTISPECIES: NusG domain II-containing protein [Megasphaera]EGS36345.1 hypothetical protein HMPREF1040_1315 [Megasphaera sp. UPII 135-E]MUP48989.1 NusG domain II-containing protein [Veillonellaceae bacterium M2-8]MUP59564.1 NusG domain II-containing protein [Veillonellaceae bacterium M2-4]PNH21571.1 hypothetical protein CAL30_05900 [Megasphaera genomosp. type_2]
MPKKWDVILIITLLLLSLIPEGIFVLQKTTHPVRTHAVIHVDGAIYKTIPLTGHKGTFLFTIHTSKGYNTVVVKNESIGITNANCPDKLCVHQGFISQVGSTTVCLPHRVLIEIKSDQTTTPDIIPAH